MKNQLMIASELSTLSKDVANLPDMPSDAQTKDIIWHLYNIMRQLSDLSEGR